MKSVSTFVLLLALILLPVKFVVAEDTVYLTKEEALNLALGKNCPYTYSKIELDQNILEILTEHGVSPEAEPIAHLFQCLDSTSGKIRYAFIDQQIGKHLPITFFVALDAEGAVSQVEIMVYRESYGAGAKDRSFMQQFEGKEVKSELKLGSNIKHVSGATLSSKAITRGVERALLVWNYYIKEGNLK